MAREWKWEGHESSFAVADGVTTLTEILAAPAFGKGTTIARVIGEVYIMKSVASTGVPTVGAGLIVLEQSNGVGSDPLTSYDGPWMWHKATHLIPHDTAGDFSGVRFTVDVRGMRKMGANERLIFMSRINGTTGSFGFGLRVGIKLP